VAFDEQVDQAFQILDNKGTGGNLEDRAEQKEMIAIVNELLEKMDENRSKIFSLFYFSQLSLAEICTITELPLGTVKSNISRAKSEIRDILVKRGLHL